MILKSHIRFDLILKSSSPEKDTWGIFEVVSPDMATIYQVKLQYWYHMSLIL